MSNQENIFDRGEVEYLCEIAFLFNQYKINIEEFTEDEMTIDEMLYVYQFILHKCNKSDKKQSLLQTIYDTFDSWTVNEYIREYISDWKDN